MPGAQVSPTRVDPDQARITVSQAFMVWAATWIAGNLLGAGVVAATGYSGASEAPVWVSMALAAALWGPMLIGLWLVSDRLDARRFADEYGLRFKLVDLTGIPVGVLAQLVVVRLVYWPLERGWPDVFSRSRVERNARDLYDQAHGGWLLGLILIVVIGAPVVEELMYRGLLQGAMVRRLNDAVAVVAVAAFFAAIHFRWVEFPGLFVFGLILGVCARRTGRLGMGIAAHMAFNATGLLLVARI
ncbi:MAG TPA: CPBP family intramembrane glutamic endopeptidase [Ilumatobacteraceae bacterium]|nr:CPBP family intramembrane glutamic endopeptidase [Ilumatobacteraceae bacterium]